MPGTVSRHCGSPLPCGRAAAWPAGAAEPTAAATLTDLIRFDAKPMPKDAARGCSGRDDHCFVFFFVLRCDPRRYRLRRWLFSLLEFKLFSLIFDCTESKKCDNSNRCVTRRSGVASPRQIRAPRLRVSRYAPNGTLKRAWKKAVCLISCSRLF